MHPKSYETGSYNNSAWTFKIIYNLPCEQNKGYLRNMVTWPYMYLFMLSFMQLFIDALCVKQRKYSLQ